jgi:guanosine-3',5'-bis(diphosphate) 3'-pyrophosphohydrolase
MKEWIMVLKAADAAARWHIDQRRKGAAKEPYINHLLEVASLVAAATEGKDPNLVIAALLHDAIADCEVPREMIADTFGTDVADLVAEVTDDKSLPKAERKRLQEETASTKSPRAKVLKLADKISNLRSLVSSPAQDWSGGASATTSIFLAGSSRDYAAPMPCLRSNSTRPRALPNSRLYQPSSSVPLSSGAMESESYDQMRAVVQQYHAGQTRNGGHVPYAQHCERVAHLLGYVLDKTGETTGAQRENILLAGLEGSALYASPLRSRRVVRL